MRRELLRILSLAAAIAKADVAGAMGPCINSSPAPTAMPADRTSEENADIRKAFIYLQEGSVKGLEDTERILGRAIERGLELNRPLGENAMLLIGRAKARIELNELAGGRLKPKLEAAIEDYTKAIAAMCGEPSLVPVLPNGTAAYQEFADAFVRRGLANEGLRRWEEAVDDYSMAVLLWGGAQNDFRPGEFSQGGRLGVNPYVLNFRGNALSRLGRYAEGVSDYKVAGAQFAAIQDAESFATSLANQALAFYGAGQVQESEQLMRRILLRDPGSADMHAALAAALSASDRPDLAETEWQAACERTESGCARYKDQGWVQEVRRWPPTLADALARFLRQKVVPGVVVA